ncbi:MAG TPA: bifunctional UDP-sugar hydrolase/5'-nucleotidase [candidate division Zixibacteria bacterium]
MPRRRRKRIWFAFLIILIFALFLLYEQNKKVKLTLLYWNDFHAAIKSYPSSEEDSALISGSDYFAGYLDSLKTLDPNSIIVCAGDEFTGDPLSTLTSGRAQIEILNYLKPDIFELGNHEFDYGIENLKKDIEVAQFPVVCANLVYKKNNELFVQPYIILNRGKLRIAFIGLITEGLEKMLKQNEELEVLNAESTLTFYMKGLEEKSDFQILVSHMGDQKDKSIARNIEGLELIIGGHSHTTIFKPFKINNTLICQAGSRGRYLGKLELFLNSKGEIVSYHNNLIETRINGVKPDSLVQNRIEELERNTGIDLDEKIGDLLTPWVRKDDEESNIGNFLADAMRSYARADVAFTNSGGIRKNLRVGPITVRDIWEIAPFSDRLVVLKITGEELLNILEKNCRKGIDLLQVSGVRYSYTLERPFGERVIEIKVNNRDIIPNKSYKVVINDYILGQSKDFLGIPKQNLEYEFLPDLDREVFIREVKRKGQINSKIEGRIIRSVEVKQRAAKEVVS